MQCHFTSVVSVSLSLFTFEAFLSERASKILIKESRKKTFEQNNTKTGCRQPLASGAHGLSLADFNLHPNEK